MDECFEKIDSLLRKQKKSQVELTTYLGLSRATYTHWKNGRNRSYRHYLFQIAKFFHIPVTFFDQEYSDAFEANENNWMCMDALSTDEINIILNLRKLGKQSVDSISKIIVELLKSSNNN